MSNEKIEPTIVSADEMERMQIEAVENVGALKTIRGLEYKIEEVDSTDAAYFLRLGMEDMRSLLKNAIEELDKKMIELMKDRNIKSIESGHEGRKAVIFYGNEKAEKITKDGAATLKKLLKPESSDPDKLMAFEALSGGVSVWKKAKVKEFADTLGKEQKDFIDVRYTDKLTVSYVPKYILEGK